MATAAAAADAAPAPAKGKKKLIIIVAAVLVLVLGGGGAFLMMKKKAAAAEEGDGEEAAAHAPAATHKAKPGTPPTFVPLEPFVVNLADKETDRYAQIGITLEIEDPAFADQLKAYMPAIRSGILMTLAHKTSTELLQAEGKLKLADEIMREAVRPLGIELDDEDEDAPPKAEDTPKKKKKKKKAAQVNPIKHVHFSNFIIQ